MNNDLREQVRKQLGYGGKYLTSDELNELITLIRTDTLDEVDEAIYREQPYTPAEATKVIDNLRDNDE